VSNKRLTTEEFIEKAKAVHSEKYDYSLVEYINAKTKVKIICPEHGVFEQRPNLHVSQKQGCSKCRYIKIKQQRSMSKYEFIEKAKQIHGNKYDYSLVNYVNNYTKVKIICPEHGIFKQFPNNHLIGRNCNKCGNKISRLKQIKNTQYFIQKAKAVHGDRYDYSLVDYQGINKNIKVICLKHGVFTQRADHHLNGHGCPACNEPKGEEATAKYLDDKNIDYLKQYRFNDCINKRPLPFDFYLPNNNVLIEYDGRQHYKPIDFFGGEKGLKYRRQNDAIKNKYCKDNNIKLIRIKYNENIEDKLTEILL